MPVVFSSFGVLLAVVLMHIFDLLGAVWHDRECTVL